MKAYWRLYGSAFLFLLIFSPARGISCFTCASLNTPECGDHFKIYRSDSQHVNPCQGTCVKRRGRDVNGQVTRIVIERSCISLRSEGCYDENLGGISFYSCACNTNFCNSSPLLQLSNSVIILCPLLYFIFKS